MTRLIELHIRIPFVNKQEDLQGLTRLQRLALDFEYEVDHPPGTTFHPFVFPEAASITKLRFYNGEDANEVGKRCMCKRMTSIMLPPSYKRNEALCAGLGVIVVWAQSSEGENT